MTGRTWRLLACLASLLWLQATAQADARVAIIIDDMGNNLPLGQRAVALPGAVTYSVLPQLPYSRDLALKAHAAGKEVMLHLPMEAVDGRALGPGGLDAAMSRADFSRALRVNLGAVPHVVGVNNHMGSLLTRQAGAMRWLMSDLKCIGGLYFVDSRTDVRTVAGRTAREAGLPNARRDVFLDNLQEPAHVRAQLQRLVRKARAQGSAIGIGHPYPATLEVLAQELPRLLEQGIQLVPVSRLVKTQTERSEQPWLACSSPLPTVAKNSKP